MLSLIAFMKAGICIMPRLGQDDGGIALAGAPLSGELVYRSEPPIYPRGLFSTALYLGDVFRALTL